VAAALRYLASSVRGLTELELLDLLSCNDDAVTAAMSQDVVDDSRTSQSQSRLLCRFPHRLWHDMRSALGTYRTILARTVNNLFRPLYTSTCVRQYHHIRQVAPVCIPI